MTDTSNGGGSDPNATPEPEYQVGPGRPPKEYQYKPGQSGNPKGAKRKPKSILPDLKAILKQALGKTVQVKQGDRERTLTMAAAGIHQLVAQYAKGDRHARRDLIMFADKLGIDLVAGEQQALQEGLATNHAAILAAYVQRQSGTAPDPTRVTAPPELLDDDPEDTKNDNPQGQKKD